MHFHHWKISYFDWNFIEVCSLGFNWQKGSVVSGNGLAPNRRQVITWTYADPVHWRIYAALGWWVKTTQSYCHRARNVKQSPGVLLRGGKAAPAGHLVWAGGQMAHKARLQVHTNTSTAPTPRQKKVRWSSGIVVIIYVSFSRSCHDTKSWLVSCGMQLRIHAWLQRRFIWIKSWR